MCDIRWEVLSFIKKHFTELVSSVYDPANTTLISKNITHNVDDLTSDRMLWRICVNSVELSS